MTENIEMWVSRGLSTNWSVSHARETEGYAVCTLKWGDKKLASCNGGGYDMVGTVFAIWMCRTFKDELKALKLKQFPSWDHNGITKRGFYGLTFHDPNYDPGKTKIKCKDGVMRTIDEAEKLGESLGLERYQDQFKASSPTPTKRHTIPYMDGACGLSAVEDVMHALGIKLRHIDATAKRTTWLIEKYDVRNK